MMHLPISYLTLCALLAFALTPTDSHARSSRCPKFKTPKIYIKTVTAPPDINHRNDLGGIRRIAKSNKKDMSISNKETPVGLTEAAMSLDSSFRIRTSKSPRDPMTCAQITKLTVTYGFHETTIYMPTELKSYTCGYSVVLNHEKKHVATDKKFLRHAAPRIRRDLEKVVRKLGVIRSGSSGGAQQRLSTQLDKEVSAIGNRYAKERRKWHEKVDTPQEYKRISRSCGGRIRKIVSKAKSLKGLF